MSKQPFVGYAGRIRMGKYERSEAFAASLEEGNEGHVCLPVTDWSFTPTSSGHPIGELSEGAKAFFETASVEVEGFWDPEEPPAGYDGEGRCSRPATVEEVEWILREGAKTLSRMKGASVSDKPASVAPVSDDIANPPHYTRLSPQPIDVIEAWGLNFHVGCCLKYLARCGHKEGADPLEDLRKALWYLNREVERRLKEGVVVEGQREGGAY